MRPYEELIVDIPNYPKPGVVFKDLTPAFADADAFAAMVDDLAAHFADRGITKVVGAEARGFIVGAAVALRLGAGFVPCRKPASCRARCCASPMRWNTAPTCWRFTPTRSPPTTWCSLWTIWWPRRHHDGHGASRSRKRRPSGGPRLRHGARLSEPPRCHRRRDRRRGVLAGRRRVAASDGRASWTLP